MRLTAGRFVTPGGVRQDVTLDLDGGRVTGVEDGTWAGAEHHAAVVVPGFIDLHLHGGGGGSFDDGTARQAIEFHRARGTTTLLASLTSADAGTLTRRLAGLAGLVEQGDLAGIHLEGPWLSPHQAGAHPVEHLRNPDIAEWQDLWTASRGTIRMVTLAPELPGATSLIKVLGQHGVVAAVGHTDADHATTRAAVRAGARVGTHLFTAMRPLHHREPGPVIALLEDPRVVVELVPDGVHLHPAVYAEIVRSVGPQRVAAVTNAGAPGVPGITTMDVVFRAAVAAAIAGGADWDTALVGAVLQTHGTPARVLAMAGGAPAAHHSGLVLLDENLHVTTVLTDGIMTPASRPRP